MELNEIQTIIKDALAELITQDAYLLKHDVHERTIASHLCNYIRHRVKPADEQGWNVDAEYNKNLNEAKSVCCEKYQQKFNYPDIIIHRRGYNNYNFYDKNNILIIEIKKSQAFNKKLKDVKKIQCFIESSTYAYLYGLFINLNAPNGEPEFVYFKRVGEHENYKAIKA